MEQPVALSRRLFWFLRDGIRLNLADPAMLDLYVQQVVTQGNSDDVRSLLKLVDRRRLGQSLNRLNRFLPVEVRSFWDDAFASS